MFNHTKAKQLVEASKLKRSAIASEATIKDSTLVRYLNGEGNPSPSVVRLLAKTLEVDESELLTQTNDQKAG
jgi:transcriptional regulator with XRE-family HTH domain